MESNTYLSKYTQMTNNQIKHSIYYLWDVNENLNEIFTLSRIAKKKKLTSIDNKYVEE